MKPGDTLDRYAIEGRLGRGGMGEVFEALDTRLGRKVALKLLPSGSDEQATQRLIREARAAAAFQHPNAVVVYDVGEFEGQAYIAMELVRGDTLRRFIGDPMPVARRVRWLVDAARALAAAHTAGIVHRDVKPDNVMIREDGTVKVLDFGIARRPNARIDPSAPTEANVAMPTLTEAGVVVGTPAYASPEQLRSEPVDGRSDQFSWAVMSYELLSGGLPWSAEGDTLAMLSQILSSEPTPLHDKAPDVPVEVAAVVTRALSKAPAARFETMTELCDALDEFAELAPKGHKTRSSGSIAVAETPQTVVTSIAKTTGRAVFVSLAILGGLFAAGLALAGATGHLQLDFGSANDAGVDGAAASAPAEVNALACEDATAEGEGGTPLMKSAIGIGACARLATAMGIDWKVKGAPPLVVDAKLAKDHTDVTLSISGKRAAGSGPTPLDAIGAAIAELDKQLAPQSLSADEVHAWGATDSAGARRIERVWRMLLLGLLPNHETALRELLASDPGSPWPHAFASLVWPRGSPDQEAERKKAIDLVDKLPQARGRGLKAVLSFIGPNADHDALLQELRTAYGASPDDADIAGLYAAIAMSLGAEEGFAVLDRLVAKFPTKSLVSIENAITSPSDRDLDRDQRYLDALQNILPETHAWYHTVRELAYRGKFDEAREALAFGERFGLSSANAADASNIEETRAFVELAAFEPKAAREVAKPMLSDPRRGVVASAASIVAESYLLEGRFEDALEAQRREIDRGRGYVGPHELAASILSYAATARYLGRKPVDPALLDEARKSIDAAAFLPPTARAAFLAAIAFARTTTDGKKAKTELGPALADLEIAAAKETDSSSRATLELTSLPLVRLVRGDAAAADIWRTSPRASYRSREAVALEAGFALEKSGATDEAEKAYLVAADPTDARSPLERMIAVIRLAEIHRASGRDADAAKDDAIVAHVWSSVDPQLLARFKKL